MPVSSTDAMGPLVDRANHLEVLIVSNLLGFLLAATSTMFAAIYGLRSGDKPLVTPIEIFTAASVLYIFLSGYYYFMLAQFYACIIALIPHAVNAGLGMQALWGTLRFPSFHFISRKTANIAMLLSVPALPLAFSISALFFLRLLIEDGSHSIGIFPTVASASIQVIVCILMITVPFREFIKATITEPHFDATEVPSREGRSRVTTQSD